MKGAKVTSYLERAGTQQRESEHTFKWERGQVHLLQKVYKAKQ